jgi:hypothetical protein
MAEASRRHEVGDRAAGGDGERQAARQRLGAAMP